MDKKLNKNAVTNVIILNFSDDIKDYMIWGYYVSPMMYGQNAIAINEFLSERWSAVSFKKCCIIFDKIDFS